MSTFSKKITNEDLIKNFRVNPKVFYVYYTVLNKREPNFESLVTDLKTLNEMVGYRSMYGKKFHEDHKYNLVKNVFWNKCGFNDWLKDNYLKKQGL